MDTNTKQAIDELIRAAYLLVREDQSYPNAKVETWLTIRHREKKLDDLIQAALRVHESING